MTEQNDQPVIDAPEVTGEEGQDAAPDPVETGVPDSLREQIAGEPGPADEELRAKSLNPNEVPDSNAASRGEEPAVDEVTSAEEADLDATEDEGPGFPEDEPDPTPETQDDEADA